MHLLRITAAQFDILASTAATRFEQRLLDLLDMQTIHDPRPIEFKQKKWRKYIASAKEHGLVAEQETALYVFVSAILDRDAFERDAKSKALFFRQRDHQARTALLEKWLAAAVTSAERINLP